MYSISPQDITSREDIESATQPESMQEVHFWPRVFLIVAVPLLSCVASFLLVNTNYFREHADPLWVQASSQIFQARNVSCDVVVYGDSTAITGVDPSLVQTSTRLKTCNIAQTKASLVVSGTSALDVFLENNPRPHILVLQFGAADFYHPHSWNDTTAYMEGVVNLLRYYPHTKLLHAFLDHPEIAFGMMHYAYITGPLNWWRDKHRAPGPKNIALDVHFVRSTPAYVNCDNVVDIDPIFHRPDQAFITEMRSHYSIRADHVLIDVAPTSECDQRYHYLEQELAGTDNKLERYPTTLFNEGYSHFTTEGARRWSQELSNQLELIAANSQPLLRSQSQGKFSDGIH